MKCGRVLQNVLISVLTLAQVLLCRLTYRKASLRRVDGEANAAAILVIRCESKIGDNLLNVPFLRAVRAQYPNQSIHLLHHVAARSIYEHCPYVDQRIEITWPMSSPVTLWRRLRLSASAFHGSCIPFGLTLVPRWDEDLYAPFLAWMSGSDRVVGFSRRVNAEKSWRNFGTDLLFTDALLDNEKIYHESVRPLRLLRHLAQGPSAYSGRLEFWFSEEDRQRVNSLKAMAGPSSAMWIAMAPGAALDRRRWPLARFCEIAQLLGQRHNVRLIFLGSAGETADCEVLRQVTQAGSSLNLAGELSLAETAAALQACRLFIGNDSGLLHLACAVLTPVVEVSCHPVGAPDGHANSPSRFGPSVPGSIVLRPAQPLAPMCRLGCASDTAHCITSVDSRSVIEAIDSIVHPSKANGSREHSHHCLNHE